MWQRPHVREPVAVAVRAGLISAALVIAAGCGGSGQVDGPVSAAPVPGSTSEAKPDRMFVGRSTDGVFSVGVAVHEGRATGFVSDGRELGVWYDGEATDGLLDLRAADGSTLVGGIHGRVVHGGVTSADGAEWSFVAVQGEEPTGLYTAAAVGEDGDRIGWVRFLDDTVVGVADVRGSLRTAPAMTPPITVDDVAFEPARRVVGGTRIEVGAG